MQKYYNKPKNWQDFEVLCSHLWKEVFHCYDINRHGRQGQRQNGVDIYGYINNSSDLFGIQCKGKDDYNHVQITEQEIEEEINKVLQFAPKLSLFIFATTTKRDKSIQEYIRQKDQTIFASYGMHISIKFWDCIEELLEFHVSVRDWYEGSFSNFHDAEIKELLDTETLTPVFHKVTRHFMVPDPSLSKFGISTFMSINSPITDIFHRRPSVNHTWCEFSLVLSNTGNCIIEDYNIDFEFSDLEVRAVSNMNDRYTNNLLDLEANRIKKEHEELHHCSNDDFSLYFEPKNKVLVQKDERVIRIGLFPRHDINEIHIKWKLLARDFDKEGIVTIPVTPTTIEFKDTKYVNSKSEERTEIVIEEGIEHLDKKNPFNKLL